LKKKRHKKPFFEEIYIALTPLSFFFFKKKGIYIPFFMDVTQKKYYIRRAS